jgi:4-amino-4-deoxy-L-arabinose transferase-like glycosyltransferase
MIVGRLLQVLLGVLIVYLVFILARRFLSERAAFASAFVAACNPFLIFMSGYLLTENLYAALLLGALALTPQGESLLSSWKSLACGAFLLGLSALSRPTGFTFGLWIIFAFVAFGPGRTRRRLGRAGLFAVMLLLPLFPWALRNHAVFGRWVLFTTHGGLTFYQGNNESVRDIPRYYGGIAPLYALPQYSTLEKLDEIERDREAWRLGKTFVRENWRSVPVMAARKFLRFWRFKSDVGISGVKSGWWWSKERFLGKLASVMDVGFAYAVVVIPLFLVGLVGSLRAFRSFLFLYGIVVVHTLVALLFHGSLRGRIPAEPVMAIFAVLGLQQVIGWLRRPASSSRE